MKKKDVLGRVRVNKSQSGGQYAPQRRGARTEGCTGRGWLHPAKHRDEQELMGGAWQ